MVRLICGGDASQASIIARLVLFLDENTGKLSEEVEMRILGRRLPYGLSGTVVKDSHDWDLTDKLAEEESTSLLVSDDTV